jgi:hypothetical protein
MFTLFFLLVLAGILSFLTIATKGNIILAIVAAGAWIGNIAYVVLVPPSGLTAGSNTQQIIIYVLTGASIGILSYGVYESYIRRKERQAEVTFHINHKDSNTQPRNYSAIIEADRSRSESSGDESLEEYRARIYRKLHPRKNNQNRY